MFETLLKSILVLAIFMAVLLNLPGFKKTAYMGNNGYAVSSQRFNAKMEAKFDQAARQVKTYLPKQKFWERAPQTTEPSAEIKVQADAKVTPPSTALGPKTSLK